MHASPPQVWTEYLQKPIGFPRVKGDPTAATSARKRPTLTTHLYTSPEYVEARAAARRCCRACEEMKPWELHERRQASRWQDDAASVAVIGAGCRGRCDGARASAACGSGFNAEGDPRRGDEAGYPWAYLRLRHRRMSGACNYPLIKLRWLRARGTENPPQ